MRCLPVSQFLTQCFVPAAVARGCSVLTVLEYQISIRYFVEAVGDVSVDSIDRAAFDRFTGWLKSELRGRSDSSPSQFTLRKHVRQVLSVVRFACEEFGGQVPRVRAIRVRPAVRVTWTVDEVRALIGAASKLDSPRSVFPNWFWWEALLGFGFSTGLRTGELLGLKVADVNPPVLVVRAEIRKVSWGHLTYLNGDAVSAFQRTSIWTFDDPESLLFPWPHTRRHLGRQLWRLCKLAGLPRSRWSGLHALRRAHATELAFVNPAAAVSSLGHGSSATTVNHYLADRLLRDSLSALPSVFGERNQNRGGSHES